MVLTVGTFQLGNCIGKGAFGVVYKGLNLEDGEIVAIKQISLEETAQIDSVMQEIELLKDLQHPNVVRYISFIKTQEHLNIILEFVDDGALTRLTKGAPLSEQQVSRYVRQMLEGLAYLHSRQVVHCDIKCANILKTRDGTIKLTDFGVSRTVKGEEQFNQDVVGTPYWMAPEVIQLQGATTASDIWSLGCTVLELLTGKPPYCDLRSMSALYRIVEDDHPPFPDNISEELRDFLLRTFVKEPSQRWTAAQLLEHPFILQSRDQTTVTSPTETLPFLSPKAERTTVDLRKAFALLDVKNTGSITAEALKGLLRGLGSTWTDRELVVALKARNIVGTVTFEDFENLLRSCPMLSEQPLRKAFRQLDPHGSGTIRLSDLKRVSAWFSETGGLSKEEFEALKIDVLVDAEGRLDYEAWIASLLR